MSSKQPIVLAVDDEPVNLEVISEFLDGQGYELVTATSGEQAWAMLQADPARYDAVLLDRMMPGIDGIEVLRRIKQDKALKLLPVIIQTAASAPEQVAEGLRNGAFYYLPKPFNAVVLQAIVATAIQDHAQYVLEKHDVEARLQATECLDDAMFTFRTPAQVVQIVSLLASLCPSREAAHMGLTELMLNAIEHGNLGITYDEKTELVAGNRLRDEVERRLALPEFSARSASVRFRRTGKSLIFNITDEGKGFDWQPFLEMSMDRLTHNHGRGIAMARSIAFTQVVYSGSGNRVEATILI